MVFICAGYCVNNFDNGDSFVCQALLINGVIEMKLIRASDFGEIGPIDRYINLDAIAVKHNLEAEILSMLRAFEEHTGLLVSTIELRHFENVAQGKFCVSGVTIETKIT